MRGLTRFTLPGLLVLLLIIGGCGGSSDSGSGASKSGSIVGTWASGDTWLWFYGENEGSKYIMWLEGLIFDQGTYTASDGHMTWISNGGHSGSGSYTIFDNNTKLNGFTDGYGNSTTYHRYNL
jgi:hypothetical protein